MPIVILTGASGSGKTTIAREFSRLHSNVAKTCYFDSIGIPAQSEMIRQFGSGEEWQRRMTIDWMCRFRDRSDPILFEGQMRLTFIHEAAEAAAIADYTVILVDCDDESRRRRLEVERTQPDLASDRMMNWARYLRDEARERGDRILDTSNIRVSEAVALIRSHF